MHPVQRRGRVEAAHVLDHHEGGRRLQPQQLQQRGARECEGGEEGGGDGGGGCRPRACSVRIAMATAPAPAPSVATPASAARRRGSFMSRLASRPPPQQPPVQQQQPAQPPAPPPPPPPPPPQPQPPQPPPQPAPTASAVPAHTTDTEAPSLKDLAYCVRVVMDMPSGMPLAKLIAHAHQVCVARMQPQAAHSSRTHHIIRALTAASPHTEFSLPLLPSSPTHAYRSAT